MLYTPEEMASETRSLSEAVTPLNVLEVQCADLGPAHSVCAQQQDNGIVAPTCTCRAVNAGYDRLRILLGGRAWGVASWYRNTFGTLSVR